MTLSLPDAWVRATTRRTPYPAPPRKRPREAPLANGTNRNISRGRGLVNRSECAFPAPSGLKSIYIVIYIGRLCPRIFRSAWSGSHPAAATCRLFRRAFAGASARLFAAQLGVAPPIAKVLKGFGGAGVLELIEDDRSGTYRAVYTVRFATAVYVLHVFQKKSKQGIATPHQDIELVRSRLKVAEELHRKADHENS